MRGYKEEGTTTTPFDMVMLNDLDRFHLVMDVIDRVPGLASRAGHVRQQMADRRLEARAYTRGRARTCPRSGTGRGRTERGGAEPRRTDADVQTGRREARRMRVLVVNAGSSSLKLRVLDAADRTVAAADLPAPRGAPTRPPSRPRTGMARARRCRRPPDRARRHASHSAPVRIDDAVVPGWRRSPTWRRSTSPSPWPRSPR